MLCTMVQNTRNTVLHGAYVPTWLACMQTGRQSATVIVSYINFFSSATFASEDRVSNTFDFRTYQTYDEKLGLES